MNFWHVLILARCSRNTQSQCSVLALNYSQMAAKVLNLILPDTRVTNLEHCIHYRLRIQDRENASAVNTPDLLRASQARGMLTDCKQPGSECRYEKSIDNSGLYPTNFLCGFLGPGSG